MKCLCNCGNEANKNNKYVKGHNSRVNCFLIGKSFMKGKKRSDTTIRMTGKGNPKWNGGKYLSTQGYMYIASPTHPYRDSRGYVAEHRLIMEKKIGRYLLSSEHIDHINGNKLDNRSENLQIVSNGMNKKLDLLRNGHPMKGKKHTKESLKKMSLTHKGSKASKKTRLLMSIQAKRIWEKRRLKKCL